MNTTAVRRHKESSLISQHIDSLNHSFDWETISILDQAKPLKNSREFLDAWHSAINRSIEINYTYTLFERDNKIKVRRSEKDQNTYYPATNAQISRD